MNMLENKSDDDEASLSPAKESPFATVADDTN